MKQVIFKPIAAKIRKILENKYYQQYLRVVSERFNYSKRNIVTFECEQIIIRLQYCFLSCKVSESSGCLVVIRNQRVKISVIAEVVNRGMIIISGILKFYDGKGSYIT